MPRRRTSARSHAPHRTSRAFFEGLEATGRRVGAALGGRAFRLGGRFGRLVTVHPLGGCAMAHDPARGVVGPDGRVVKTAGRGAGEVGQSIMGPAGSVVSIGGQDLENVQFAIGRGGTGMPRHASTP